MILFKEFDHSGLIILKNYHCVGYCVGPIFAVTYAPRGGSGEGPSKAPEAAVSNPFAHWRNNKDLHCNVFLPQLPTELLEAGCGTSFLNPRCLAERPESHNVLESSTLVTAARKCAPAVMDHETEGA